MDLVDVESRRHHVQEVLRALEGDEGSEETVEYKKFITQCISAFNILRKHSHHLINLFQLVCFTALCHNA